MMHAASAALQVWALAGGAHDTSCLCTRDSELVRLNKVGGWELKLSQLGPSRLGTDLWLHTSWAVACSAA